MLLRRGVKERLCLAGRDPTAELVAQCEALVQRGLSLSRATGIAYFGDAVLRCDGVLSPRADSEVVVEAAVAHARGDSVVDLGCGSGALLVSFLQQRRSVKRALAVDLCEHACAVTSENLQRNGVEAEVRRQSWTDEAHRSFDVALWNPPYVKTRDCHGDDPLAALDGGEDGLRWFRNPPWHWVKPDGLVSNSLSCVHLKSFRSL
jgi:methylase of polypeptide subunit release factors